MIDAELIKKFATCIGYEFNQEGSKPPVVIVGEIHHDPVGCCCQEILVAMLRPEYVLIEVLHALSYDPEKDCVQFRGSTTVGKYDSEEKEIFEKDSDNFHKHMSKKYNIKLIGCDLSIEERCGLIIELGIKTYGFNPLSINDSRIDDARENKMGEIILTQSRNFSEPLIAIIGHYHARKDSKIHKNLKGQVDYICIWSQEAVDKREEEIKRNRRSNINQ